MCESSVLDLVKVMDVSVLWTKRSEAQRVDKDREIACVR